MHIFHSYNPKEGHLLPHDPIKSIVAPRPIGWISTVDLDGNINLAPYSFFNLVNSNPPMVMFSSEGRKDTLQNVEATNEFCINLATYELADQMAQTGLEVSRNVDEMASANLKSIPSTSIRSPRIAESPASLECRVVGIQQLEELGGDKLNTYMVIGQIVMVHINKLFLREGYYDLAATKTIARAGYLDDYVLADSTFKLPPLKCPSQ